MSSQGYTRHHQGNILKIQHPSHQKDNGDSRWQLVRADAQAILSIIRDIADADKHGNSYDAVVIADGSYNHQSDSSATATIVIFPDHACVMASPVCKGQSPVYANNLTSGCNYLEYFAVKQGLEKVAKHFSTDASSPRHVLVITDSEYVMNFIKNSNVALLRHLSPSGMEMNVEHPKQIEGVVYERLHDLAHDLSNLARKQGTPLTKNYLLADLNNIDYRLRTIPIESNQQAR